MIIKNTKENIYCCNNRCTEKDKCWRYKMSKYISIFEKTKCLYLHKDKDDCLLIIEEDKKTG